MSLIGVKHGEDIGERVSGGVGLRIRSFGRSYRTACGTIRASARGRGAARVARAGGVFLAATLALLLALSPTVALSQVTGGTTTGDDPYPSGDGGGHSIGDEKSFGEVIQEVWEYVSGEVTSAWDSFFGGDGFTGSSGGDFGGGSSSSSGSSSSGETQTDTPVTIANLQLVTPTESSNGYHISYTNYTYSGNGKYIRNDTTSIYRHTSDTISEYPKCDTIQWRGNQQIASAIRSWQSGGYDVMIYTSPYQYGNANGTGANVWVYFIQSGGLRYESDTRKYFINAGYKYAVVRPDGGTFADGSTVFIQAGGASYWPSTSTKGSEYEILNMGTRTTTAPYYVAVLYADGSTGTGGAPSGSGGGSGSSGDTYNTTNNYNTTTTYNNLDLDLSPITQRQDNLMRTVNQIGKDVNKLVYKLGEDIDNDIKRLFAAILSDVAVNRNNGLKLQSILDELTDGYLQDIAGDIDLIAKELTNLQSNSAMRSIKGFLYAIYQELDEWPKGTTSGGGSSDPITVDLSTIESKLDTIISKMGQGDGGDTVINNDNDTSLGEQIGEKMNEVKERFPFSIPWDVMYILGLVRAEPVAPQFDVPVIGSDEEIHIDLSQWEPVAVVTRNGTLVLFGLGLALRSRTLIRTWGGTSD